MSSSSPEPEARPKVEFYVTPDDLRDSGILSDLLLANLWATPRSRGAVLVALVSTFMTACAELGVEEDDGVRQLFNGVLKVVGTVEPPPGYGRYVHRGDRDLVH